MDRKEMLLQVETVPKRNEMVSERELSEVVDKAAAFASMVESRGWKMLYKEFIEPRLSLDRILQAKGPYKRAETCAAVRELDMLMKVINGSIEDGQKANVKLEAHRKK